MLPTVLILATGPGIRAHSITLFRAAGYNVVAASRSLKDNLKTDQLLELHLDLSEVETIPGIFQKAMKQFGHPNVVIYNGAVMTPGSADDPLSTPSLAVINHDIAVNITGALIAAREAVRGWNEGIGGSKATFIFTGNKQNVMCDPRALTFEMAKTAAAKMIWDCHAA